MSPKKKSKGKKSHSTTGETAMDVSEPQVTVKDMLTEAELHMDEFEFELASSVCDRALEVDGRNSAVLILSASVLLELGNNELAKQRLLKAIEVNPDGEYTKYMMLAQIVGGKEAITYYMQGISVIEKICSTGAPSLELRRDLSSAYVSLAELYLTDLCDEDDAETQCQDTIQKALAADPANPEAFNVNANFLLTKGMKEEAMQALKASLNLWMPKFDEVVANPDGEAAEEDKENVVPPPQQPSMGSCLNVARLLVEMEDYDTACSVLELLLERDDEAAEVWHLLGYANYMQGEDYRVPAAHYLRQVLVFADKDHDRDLLDHSKELLDELALYIENETGIEEGEAGSDVTGSDIDSEEEEENPDESMS